jgi:Cu/Ag efflux pump CusA
MQEPTIEDIDVLFGAATPHFAYQIRQRVERLVAELPSDHAVKVYAGARLAQLDQLGHTTSKAEGGDPSAPHGV